jgi:hypothetical protein
MAGSNLYLAGRGFLVRARRRNSLNRGTACRQKKLLNACRRVEDQHAYRTTRSIAKRMGNGTPNEHTSTGLNLVHVIIDRDLKLPVQDEEQFIHVSMRMFGRAAPGGTNASIRVMVLPLFFASSRI